jgi:hypothetical protein
MMTEKNGRPNPRTGSPDDTNPPVRVKRLQVILGALHDDEWMAHLRQWRRFSQGAPLATEPGELDQNGP